MKTYKLRRKTKPGRLLRDIPRGSPVTLYGQEFTVVREYSGETYLLSPNDFSIRHCDPHEREDSHANELEYNEDLPTGLYEFDNGCVAYCIARIHTVHSRAHFIKGGGVLSGKCYALEVVEE